MQYAPDLLVNKFGFAYEMPADIKTFTLFGSMTFGNVAIYLGLFLFVVFRALAKEPLISKNEPYYNESLNFES